MAVVVEQKSRVGRFDVNFGLDLWCSVQKNTSEKRKHAIVFRFRGEINWRVAVVQDLKERSRWCCVQHNGKRIVNVSLVELRHFTFTLKSFFNGSHENIGEQWPKWWAHGDFVDLFVQLPIELKSWSLLVAAVRRLTGSTLLRFKCCWYRLCQLLSGWFHLGARW